MTGSDIERCGDNRLCRAARQVRDAVCLEGRFHFLQRRGGWFWLLIAAGTAIRIFLLAFNEGTYDVPIWESHARGVYERGLVGEYRASPGLNHPPLACWTITGLWMLAERTGIPFRILLRTPTAALDLGTAFLLGRLLRDSRYRWLAAGLYVIHPLAAIMSAYHGNTDSIIAFFVAAASVAASEGRPVWTGIALGVGIWIKLPATLAVPALGFSFPRWRDRFLCAATAVGTGLLTYLPTLAVDAPILWQRVFLYPGELIQTPAGIRVWGFQNFWILAFYLPDAWQPAAVWAIWGWIAHNTLVFSVPLVVLAWLRRRERTAIGLGATVAACYSVMYGFSSRWSFQYLAWSLPFWFTAGPRFLAGASLIVGGYIWALYAFLCGGWLLTGPWDFAGHPEWPLYLRALRNASVLFFAGAACLFLARGVRGEWRCWRAQRAGPPAEASR